MFINNWKKEILTVPNLLSLFRLVLVPVYVGLYLHARQPVQFYTAGAVITLSCLTDALDGWIARQFHMISTLGKILDPLADKLTQFALTVCLTRDHPVLHPVLALFMVKEVIQLLLAVVYLLRRQILPGALPAGKVCTTVLFVSLITLVLFPDLPQPAVNGIALADTIFLMISFFGYLSAYWGSKSILQDLPCPEDNR